MGRRSLVRDFGCGILGNLCEVGADVEIGVEKMAPVFPRTCGWISFGALGERLEQGCGVALWGSWKRDVLDSEGVAWVRSLPKLYGLAGYHPWSESKSGLLGRSAGGGSLDAESWMGVRGWGDETPVRRKSGQNNVTSESRCARQGHNTTTH